MKHPNLLETLKSYGINEPTEVIHNPSYDILYKEETSPERQGYDAGSITECGAVAVDTGIFTGRSPKDKYFVKDDTTRETLWWSDQGSNDNKPITQNTWDHLKSLVGQRLSKKKLFINDLYCGYFLSLYKVHLHLS